MIFLDTKEFVQRDKDGKNTVVSQILISNKNFSIRQISASGQCFRLNPIGERRYALVAFGKYLEIEETEKDVLLFCTSEEYEDIWFPYFDLETDYGAFLDLVLESDEYLSQAAALGYGIRILRQDLWEIIISFLISQNNNIKRIRMGIELLCRQFGEECITEAGSRYAVFPKAEALANASDEELKQCNLGYRSRYVSAAAKSVLQGEIDLEALKDMPYLSAKQSLMNLYGIGGKVADCICLFGLHHLEAFPLDTHIQKVLKENYPHGFPYESYQGFEGVIQQYMFYYDLI